MAVVHTGATVNADNAPPFNMLQIACTLACPAEQDKRMLFNFISNALGLS
ncbi:hypothetical protein ACOJCD_004308 [Cronobacter dublinensis]